MRQLRNLILTLLVLVFTACADKRIILIPSSTYYQTFNTSDFKESPKYKLDMWVETDDVNGTKKTYLVEEKDSMLNFIKNTKELRSNYNTLLRKINVFNQRINELNQNQNRKPVEIK